MYSLLNIIPLEKTGHLQTAAFLEILALHGVTLPLSEQMALR